MPESEPHRIRTHLRELDDLLGGGIVFPSSLVLIGAGGTGKTTRACAIASAVACSRRRDALIVSAEMPEHSLVVAARRAGARLEHLLILRTDDADAALAAAERHKPSAIVWDSIQALDRSGSDSAVRSLVHRMIKVGEALEAVSIVISQVAKDGTAYGSGAIEHEPDAVVLVTHETIRVTKNRFGPAPVELDLGAELEPLH